MKIRLGTILYILVLIAGIFIGMTLQQIIIVETISRAGESWEGVISNMNIEIEINETKLVEETWKIFPNSTWRNTKFDNMTTTYYSGEEK